MNKALAFEDLKSIILAELKASLESVKDNVRSDYLPVAEEIAVEAAMYASRLAAGDQSAATDLRHLKAQTVTLAARVAIRTEARMTQLIEQVVFTSVRVLAAAMIAAA